MGGFFSIECCLMGVGCFRVVFVGKVFFSIWWMFVLVGVEFEELV